MKDIQLFGITVLIGLLLALLWLTDLGHELGLWADRQVNALDALFERVRKS